MTNVVNLDDHRPHAGGPALCLECRHEWHAVAPVGVLSFECPQCGTSKGCWMGVCIPAEKTPIYTCECGNDLFFVLMDGTLCAKCGVKHNPE